ncbi:hypothetical protein TCE0_018r05922 [Talaromyces pinophilus]|uniref:Uncharacterized protein n=1 Tax=Talaromyces pinophilus TaxID=128442 RepID=A0A510NWL5_TALPI|nr:hypothetical protein TCE0_018r05922 [Talaromyces pinophilus]
MSDDEFIYDDDDDWYWYEEDNMGLGDELAENAVHSPIMVEDPSLETVDTYSDWEYYSDDYYDDDPTITTKHKTNGEPRKKRRKLSSIENIPSLSLGSSIVDSSMSMANSFKGVLWRVPVKTDDKIELYEPGKGEQVALLSDWRELVKTPIHDSNGAKADDYETNGDVKKEVGVARAEMPERVDLENGVDAKYGRYSPPPLEIENLDKTIIRQRDKLSQPELQIAPEKLPAGTMIVADSEDEEELDDTDETTIAVPEIDAVDDDKENMVLSEKEDQPPPQTSIRVEIPTLAAVMKADSLDENTPPRRRGRPKTATTKQPPTKANGTTKKAPSTQTPTKRGRKRALEAEKEDEETDDNKRRSKRVASSTVKKATKDTRTDKKRTRANSMASPKQEREKRKRI